IEPSAESGCCIKHLTSKSLFTIANELGRITGDNRTLLDILGHHTVHSHHGLICDFNSVLDTDMRTEPHIPTNLDALRTYWLLINRLLQIHAMIKGIKMTISGDAHLIMQFNPHPATIQNTVMIDRHFITDLQRTM